MPKEAEPGYQKKTRKILDPELQEFFAHVHEYDYRAVTYFTFPAGRYPLHNHYDQYSLVVHGAYSLQIQSPIRGRHRPRYWKPGERGDGTPILHGQTINLTVGYRAYVHTHQAHEESRITSRVGALIAHRMSGTGMTTRRK